MKLAWPVHAMLRSAALPLLFCASAAISFVVSSPGGGYSQRGPVPRQSDRFSNVRLITQHGQQVRFYDDLVKDRTVVINLMYSGCGEVCPANSAQLARLNELLGERMGRDITMLSISIDPVADTPERLKQYWAAFGAKPGWLFLTGNPAEIDKLRRELGAYDLDRTVDADPTQHAGYAMIGNDAANRWIVVPLLMSMPQLVGSILRVAARD